MARRGGFRHFGAGGHERVIEELTVITRVSDHVDDAHDFFFFFFFSLLFFLFFLFSVLVLCLVFCFVSFCFFFFFFSRLGMAGTILDSGTFFFLSFFASFPSPPSAGFWFILLSVCKGLKRTIFVFGGAESCCTWAC